MAPSSSNPVNGDAQANIPTADAHDVDAGSVGSHEAATRVAGNEVCRRGELLLALAMTNPTIAGGSRSPTCPSSRATDQASQCTLCDRGSDFLEVLAGAGQAIQGDVIDVGSSNCLDYVLREP